MIIILLAAAVSVYFYSSHKKTQANVQKVETDLTAQGFSNFYQREDNKFCVQIENELEQENIVKDMLWSLKDEQTQNIKEIECPDGNKGILVK